MFSASHLVVSNQVNSNIKNTLNYSLDKRLFSWGSVKPDIVPSLLIKKHYKEETLDYVIDKIEELINLKYSNCSNSLLDKYLSINLGEIIHFLSDFFCVPHSQRWEFKKRMASHIKYETTLNKIAQNYYLGRSTKIPEIKYINIDSIKTFINDLLEEYHLKEDYLNDLKYSTIVSTSITALIIKENYSKPNKFNKFCFA